mgnify:CR=1 FL=1
MQEIIEKVNAVLEKYSEQLADNGIKVTVSKRYFEESGVTYHHILDPETGYPVQNELISVTVVSQSGALSDALSTACFILGKEKAEKLLRLTEILLTENEKYNLTAIKDIDKIILLPLSNCLLVLPQSNIHYRVPVSYHSFPMLSQALSLHFE